MGDCCDRPGYQTVFSDRFARRIARTYRKRGLNDTQLRMVSFLTERGIQDASVLEIGGGVGDLQIELLRRGARSATNLEISAGYEAEAASLLKQSGLADRVTRRMLLVFSFPPRNFFNRALLSWENLLHRLRGSDFRAFVHMPAAMIATAEAQGLSVSYRHRGLSWNIVGFERLAPAI